MCSTSCRAHDDFAEAGLSVPRKEDRTYTTFAGCHVAAKPGTLRSLCLSLGFRCISRRRNTLFAVPVNATDHGEIVRGVRMSCFKLLRSGLDVAALPRRYPTRMWWCLAIPSLPSSTVQVPARPRASAHRRPSRRASGGRPQQHAPQDAQ
eukprot:3703253-Rhodomonas_salina.1